MASGARHERRSKSWSGGIAAAVGLSKPGGKDFERLVQGKGISKHLGVDVLAKVLQPIDFKWIYPGAKHSDCTTTEKLQPNQPPNPPPAGNPQIGAGGTLAGDATSPLLNKLPDITRC